MIGQMALEKPKEFLSEHKAEIVVGSVISMLGIISVVAARELNKSREDVEPGMNVPEPNDSL